MANKIEWNLGDLVRWHRRMKKSWQSGIIIEARQYKVQGSRFIVMWSDNSIRFCAPWQLASISK